MQKSCITLECAVVVATVRALKLHGDADPKKLGEENLGALESGLPNLLRHLENLSKFGLSTVVAINRFPTDTESEISKYKKLKMQESMLSLQNTGLKEVRGCKVSRNCNRNNK